MASRRYESREETQTRKDHAAVIDLSNSIEFPTFSESVFSAITSNVISSSSSSRKDLFQELPRQSEELTSNVISTRTCRKALFQELPRQSEELTSNVISTSNCRKAVFHGAPRHSEKIVDAKSEAEFPTITESNVLINTSPNSQCMSYVTPTKADEAIDGRSTITDPYSVDSNVFPTISESLSTKHCVAPGKIDRVVAYKGSPLPKLASHVMISTSSASKHRGKSSKRKGSKPARIM